MKTSLYQTLITKKENPRKEWQIFLFTGCSSGIESKHQHCGFCFFSKEQLQDYKGIDTIIMQAFTFCTELEKQVKLTGKTQHVLNIMGGELFSDNIEDKYFNDYRDYCLIIDKKAKELNLDIEYNFVTHLMYSKINRVKILIDNLRDKDINATVTTSYDFTGRYNTATKKLFMQNITSSFGKKYIRSISIVLTRTNIHKLLTNTDKDFKTLYRNGYTIYFDLYSPDSDKKSELYQPTSLDLYNTLIYLRNYYPNTYPVKDLLGSDINSMSCRRSITVETNKGCGTCKNLVCSSRQFDYTEQDNNLDIEERFLRKYNCVSCKYFNRCGLGCFLSSAYILKDDMEECPYKRFFRESLPE